MFEWERLLADNRREFAFPPEEARKFTDACDVMLLLHQKVALHYAQNGVQLFDVTSKCHLLQHLGILAGSINPGHLALLWRGFHAEVPAHGSGGCSRCSEHKSSRSWFASTGLRRTCARRTDETAKKAGGGNKLRLTQKDDR